MAERQVSSDELFRNISEQLDVPEELLRSFAKREGIDPVGLWEEKRAAMEWKRLHGNRLALGGRLASADVSFEVKRGEVEP